ncbi:MAG: HD domain-containing phosphohydrolase [Peptococcales bacterium]|jgi:putative nucleotidyltransferase with HDIG domain
MKDKGKHLKGAKKLFLNLIVAIIALTITFVILNLFLYQSNEWVYQQIALLIIYLVVTLYLSLRLFLLFRIFVRNETLLVENARYIEEIKLFTENLIKQRKEIEQMLHETNQISDKLLEKNYKLHCAQEKLFQEKEKFATLFEASQLVAATWDLEQVLPKIMELANKLVPFKTGRILLPEGEHLIIAYEYGYDKSKTNISKIKFGQGITGCAALNQEIIIVEDVNNDPRYIKEIETTRAEVAIPLIYQGELLGILDIQNTSPFNWLEFQEDNLDILVLFANFSAMVIHNSSIYTELKNSYVSIIKVLAKVIDAKDPYTHGHCERVKELSLEIGRKLELDPKDMEELEFAALLHDIGKIGLPEAILYKPGLLSPVEFEVIKSHPSIGANLIGDIPFLARTKRIIEQHHEKIDGTGYPNQIRGMQMDFLAKIISVADAIDAMKTKRPYRSAQNAIYILNELERCKGTQFDPLVTEVATMIITEEFEQINMA